MNASFYHGLMMGLAAASSGKGPWWSEVVGWCVVALSSVALAIFVYWGINRR